MLALRSIKQELQLDTHSQEEMVSNDTIEHMALRLAVSGLGYDIADFPEVSSIEWDAEREVYDFVVSRTDLDCTNRWMKRAHTALTPVDDQETYN